MMCLVGNGVIILTDANKAPGLLARVYVSCDTRNGPLKRGDKVKPDPSNPKDFVRVGDFT